MLAKLVCIVILVKGIVGVNCTFVNYISQGWKSLYEE